MKIQNKSLKGQIILIALVLFYLFTASAVFADFYVIAGSRGVGTKITSLPYEIASSGFYFIDKELSCASGSHGITITADNVTLDLMGFSLVGPGGPLGSNNGIYMLGRANVEIRNGTVRDFNYIGIYEVNTNGVGKGHRIINVRVNGNHSYGIYLSGTGHLVAKCTAVSNGLHGINAGAGCTVTGNTCYSNSIDGIQAGAGCTVTGNTCYSNGDEGIYAGMGSTITGNTCNLNGDEGIGAGTGSTVIGNTCRSNTDYGIYLYGYNLVDQNNAYANAGGNMNDPGTCTFGLNHAP